MQRSEVSGAVRPIYGSLGIKRLKVWSIHKVASYTKVHSRYHVLISGTLQYLTTFCSQRCWILLLLLH